MPTLNMKGETLELEGPSEHFLLSGITEGILLRALLENRRDIIQEDKIWAIKKGWIN